MKVTVQKFIEGVNSIYVEKPSYELGHDGSDGKCDCIGMVRGGLDRAGAKDVKNMRGTNQAARKAIEELVPIQSEAQLTVGAVVLKTRDKDDATMPLPDRYRKGGADYDPKWGETNFTHIGTVTQVNPLVITHMTSPTAKQDKSAKGWSYVGDLPWVEYEPAPEPGPEPPDPTEPVTAIVTAEKGSTVKMRAKPSTKCRLYWDVPIGSEVIVDEKGDEWSRITWNDREGYMMTRFLDFREEPEPEPETYLVIIPGLTKEEAEEVCAAWENSIMRKE